MKKTLKSDRNSRLRVVGWDPNRGLPSTEGHCTVELFVLLTGDWVNWFCFGLSGRSKRGRVEVEGGKKTRQSRN